MHSSVVSGGKKSKKGGFSPISSEESPVGLESTLYNSLYGSAVSGGKKSKKGGSVPVVGEESMHSSVVSGGKKSKKGGFSPISSEESPVGLESTLYSSLYGSAISGGKKSKKSFKGSKKSKKTMKGGMESSGATSMISNFYDPTLPIDNYAELSGNDFMSAYGKIESGDIGVGMLAPYTSSLSNSANQNTDMKTGGKKSKKSKKSMKGGMESSGATSMTSNFYDPTLPIDNYAELSGNNFMSAYGKIESGDIGVGMLAPYTSSLSNSANQNTDMKTGGKKSKKSLKIGGGLIPSISSGPISSVQETITGAISGFTGFMQKLDEDYLKSVQYVKSIKIGNQRLIQGGKKEPVKKMSVKKEPVKKMSVKKEPVKKESVKKESVKKESVKKESVKKEPLKKKSVKKVTVKKIGKKSIKKGGSNGSDFALTLNSRGPVNAPDDYWGVPGEQWFRQFNKTGDYIPNSKLPYAATPTLAGVSGNNEVIGYDLAENDYGKV
jgi:hypothetical protein